MAAKKRKRKRTMKAWVTFFVGNWDVRFAEAIGSGKEQSRSRFRRLWQEQADDGIKLTKTRQVTLTWEE